MDIELVVEGLGFPEGPVAMADGSIVLTEIRAQRISRITPDGRRETVAETPGGPNGLAVGPDGALYICNNGGRFSWIDVPGATYPGDAPATHTGGSIQRLDLATGALDTLYRQCDGDGPQNIVLVFAAFSGTSWITSQCSVILPSVTRKISTMALPRSPSFSVEWMCR